jgi:PAS domain S-box-containing protein
MTIVGAHDPTLVALSILIATLASYTALDLASRLRASAGWVRWAWLSAAAVAMGGGIWSMHFVAMLAFSMPDMTVNYHLGLTLLSLVLPIAVTGVGFVAASRHAAGYPTLILSGLFMGSGIVAMHYLGMAAMEMLGALSYTRLWVAASVLIAIGASTIALWLAFRRTGLLQRLLASVAMGLAVSGMHYAAMQAAVFTAHPAVDEAHGHASIGQTNLALAVGATTLLILSLGLVAAMFDRRFALLTEREALALRESEERFRTLYRQTPLPLHALDANGHIEDVSDAWLALLGYAREEVVGRPLTNFMTDDSIRRRQVIWPKLLTDGETKDVDFRLVSKGGDILDVLMSGRVDRGPDGRTRIFGGTIDVTARRRAEEALRKAQKMEAVGQLTGGIAHDFNNLLTVIVGNAEILSEDLADPQFASLATIILTAAEKGAELTKHLLAFARRQTLKPERLRLDETVRTMEPLLRRAIGEAIDLRLNLGSGMSLALTDRALLESAILNLIVNARDAMARGGTVTITTGERHAGPGEGLLPFGQPVVYVRVTDTGEGMRREVLERAFEPFFTTKEVGKGSGLGLSMVYGFAQQSGGHVSIRSEPAQGTTVTILLPALAATTWPAPAGEAPGVVPARRRARVLVVEDEEHVLHFVSAQLTSLGYEVTGVSTGPDALDLLRGEGGYDLLFTDVVLPKGISGVELARQARGLRLGLKVLLTSGYPEEAFEHHGRPEAGTRLLRKPYRRRDLANAVTAVLEAS